MGKRDRERQRASLLLMKKVVDLLICFCCFYGFFDLVGKNYHTHTRKKKKLLFLFLLLFGHCSCRL